MLIPWKRLILGGNRSRDILPNINFKVFQSVHISLKNINFLENECLRVKALENFEMDWSSVDSWKCKFHGEKRWILI